MRRNLYQISISHAARGCALHSAHGLTGCHVLLFCLTLFWPYDALSAYRRICIFCVSDPSIAAILSTIIVSLELP